MGCVCLQIDSEVESAGSRSIPGIRIGLVLKQGLDDRQMTHFNGEMKWCPTGLSEPEIYVLEQLCNWTNQLTETCFTSMDHRLPQAVLGQGTDAIRFTEKRLMISLFDVFVHSGCVWLVEIIRSMSG